MNSAQEATLKIIGEAAVEVIAAKHDTTVEMVMAAISAKHEVVVNQFNQLISEGLKLIGTPDLVSSLVAKLDAD